MIIRNGFVSNSSSSSFIIKNEADMELVKHFDIRVYKVSDIINALKPINDIIETFIAPYDYSECHIPDYLYKHIRIALFDVLQYDMEYYEELIELNKKYPNCYITEAYNRDRAYENNIYLDVFEGDL